MFQMMSFKIYVWRTLPLEIRKKKVYLVLFYLYKCLCVCVPTRILVPIGDQNRLSDPLSLELEVIVSHYVDARN